MIIHVDHRESKVIDTIKVEFAKPPIFGEAQIDVIIKTLDIGDYMISVDTGVDTESILAIVERKTLADYGASIIDGRAGNLDKLLRLRENSGCRIYYIVEGQYSPGADEKFGGVAYHSILANMVDISIVHDIHIIRTRDIAGTASQLKFLCERYYKLYPQISGRFTGGGSINEIVKKCELTPEQLERKQLLMIWSNLLSNSTKISSKTPAVKASIIAQKWALLDWINGEINDTELQAIRVNGNKLPSKDRDKLGAPLDLLGQKKLLTCINGITAATADALINTKPLGDILRDEESASIVVNPIKGTKLGKAKYKRIVKLCSMRG